jgi:hypothetical protein
MNKLQPLRHSGQVILMKRVLPCTLSAQVPLVGAEWERFAITRRPTRAHLTVLSILQSSFVPTLSLRLGGPQTTASPLRDRPSVLARPP